MERRERTRSRELAGSRGEGFGFGSGSSWTRRERTMFSRILERVSQLEVAARSAAGAGTADAVTFVSIAKESKESSGGRQGEGSASASEGRGVAGAGNMGEGTPRGAGGNTGPAGGGGGGTAGGSVGAGGGAAGEGGSEMVSLEAELDRQLDLLGQLTLPNPTISPTDLGIMVRKLPCHVVPYVLILYTSILSLEPSSLV